MVYVLAACVLAKWLTHKKPGDYRLAIALASQKKVDLRPLVTHRYAVKVRA